MQALELWEPIRSNAAALLALAMLGAGISALAWPVLARRGGRRDVARRLNIGAQPARADTAPRRAGARQVRERAAKSVQGFYARSDPAAVAKLRMQLVQAGYFDPRAVGLFFVFRFAGFAAGAVSALLLDQFGPAEAWFGNRWFAVLAFAALGYFAPTLYLSRAVRQRMAEYRNGFPDFMDLMIVCSDAGMSMEAGVDRVARELQLTHPALGQNLQLVSLELRAGRGLEDALKSLADRLALDEVRSFATLLQQSKELGTSLSNALRVFSDEMRHKRMSLAEEKAHALPAKMSIPVTVCILPVVIMIAIIPIIVKMSGGGAP